MWPWIKRWRDWLMNDLWPIQRLGTQAQALHFSYEKAGLTVANQPVPWCAEAVLVEARLRLPGSTPRRKADFSLRVGTAEPAAALELQHLEAERCHRVLFRVAPPPGCTAACEVLYRTHVLGRLTLPFQSRDDFVQGLRIQMPTVSVRLGDQTVACQTFVASQCRGLLAAGIVTSPTSLVPLLDLDLQVEFRSERGGTPERVPVRLVASQLASRHALATVVPRRYPRRIGTWLATWWLAGRHLETQRVRAISTRAFERSLRVLDSRLVLRWPSGQVTLARQLPPGDRPPHLGPCFLLASREPGMAGLVPLQVQALVPGAVAAPTLMDDTLLVTDGPTMFAPGTLPLADLGAASGFELRLKGHTLGQMSLSPAPTASFTSEGGFKSASEFAWSPAAEEELTDRLNRLIEGSN